MLRWFLFETGIGEKLLALLEQKAGLAVVEASELADTEVVESVAEVRGALAGAIVWEQRA